MRQSPTSARVHLARRAILRVPTRSAITRVAFVGLLALLVAAATPVVAPRTARADHNGFYVVCPDPVPEGNSARMGIRRSGYEVLGAVAFTDHLHYTAESDDYTEYHGVKFKQSEGTTLWFPIETTEDTRPERDETFAIGFWDSGLWHHCVVTIVDDDMPRIIGVNLVSSPIDGWANRAGDAIDVAVRFDAKVEVEGSPLLALFVGEGDASTTWRGARYLRGSGTFELLFRYIVQPGDLDLNGLTVGAAATAADRTAAYGFAGTINAMGTDAPVDYSHSGLEPALEQRVDGRPHIQSRRITSVPEAGHRSYRVNEVIEFTFNYDSRVVVEGDVCVTLFVGPDGFHADNTKRQAVYRSGSGTDTLVFGYTVRPGDTDPDGVTLLWGTVMNSSCGSGTIEGADSGVEHNPWYRGQGYLPGHKIDTAPPATSSAAITSRPSNGAAYTTGETISVEITFSENVTISGYPYLELDIGGETGRATLAADRGTNSRAVFEYEVQSGDGDADGVGISANSLFLNNGGIHDRAGNAAGLSHPAVAADPAQRVATSVND